MHGKQKSGGKRYGTSEPCGRAGRKFIPRAWHRHWPFRRRFARCDCLFHHGPFGQQPQPRVYRKDGGIITQAADPSKLEDPSLIIYAPVRVFGNRTIVTNGDQTDTIFEAYEKGRGFAKALRTRTFEPDAPNFTPRISGVVKVSKKGKMSYKMSILRSDEGNGGSVERFFFEYPQPVPGEGRFLHTYRCDGNPIPSFSGEPEKVRLSGDIDTFTNMLWNS